MVTRKKECIYKNHHASEITILTAKNADLNARKCCRLTPAFSHAILAKALVNGKNFMLTFQWYQFSELSLEQLYDLLILRSRIFVLEQQCVYLDPDGQDKAAVHLLGIKNGQIKASLRLFLPDEQRSSLLFGRVCTEFSSRNTGYGKLLMQELLDYCKKYFPHIPLECSAQYRLERFYNAFGFKSCGNIYDEDGMPHIKMCKDADFSSVPVVEGIAYCN